jgi:uncharacterized protein with FMN-binding domain
MNKRPLLLISGTVMGTVGVLSYVPSVTNAMAPLATSPSSLASSAQAGIQAAAPVSAAAPAPKTSSKAAASKAARVAKALKKKSVTKTAHKSTKTTSSATAAVGGAAAPAASTATRTIAGSTIQTPFGPFQVQITVQGTKIVSARALQTPQGGRSSSINQQAVPYLIQQTLAAQSASIQGVGGATYSSDGWAQSLQAAIAKI